MLNLTVDDLPDEIVVSIMTFAHYGPSPLEETSPATRFAHVSKKWNRLWRNNVPNFATNELSRVLRTVTSVEEAVTNRGGGAGDVRTIVDSWTPVPGVPRWWTSGYEFEGGAWTEADVGRNDGPFWLAEGRDAPTLLVRFDRRVTIRAVCFWARNKPRLVQCLVRRPTSEGSEFLVDIALPENTVDVQRQPKRFHPPTIDEFARIVAAKMPQGRPAREEDHWHHLLHDLPSVLGDPLTIEKGESFCIRILATQERGWTGINQLLLFE